MLTEIHILLTYKCTSECDHCFLYSSPNTEGTMTIQQIKNVLEEAEKIGNIIWIYFEGGEPFLFYPVLVEGVKLAKDKGFKVGVVTNGYWAISEADALTWLKPIAEQKIHDLSISDDSFHYEDENNTAKLALKAAEKLGIPSTSICIGKPFVEARPGEGQEKGKAIIGGGAMFKGRAVEKLIDGLPLRNYDELTTCPYEELETPSRVHVDCFGNIHLCQGISMGNMWNEPLSEIINNYEPHTHPICGPLIEGGPAFLAQELNIKHEEKYVDECHFCFELRKKLVGHFQEYLTPKQVYGF